MFPLVDIFLHFRCRLKMTGDLMLSFPAGIVRVITENPNPTMLSFKVTNATQIHQILLNKQLLSQYVNMGERGRSISSYCHSMLTGGRGGTH